MTILKSITTVLLTLLSITFCVAQERTEPKSQPPELGKVSWYRDYDQALEVSKESGKPVLILFQEVPGCATCRNYGKEVLSNPLMTEVIENEFVPLAIYNNKGGKDRKILDKYTESPWNNPVVTIVNDKGEKLVKRVAGNYTAVGLYEAMEASLKIYKRNIPEYMKLLGEELHANNNQLSEKYYSMYCFWTGEKELGSQEGVLHTEAGFMKGYEVVKVIYDSSMINENTLNKFAISKKMHPIEKDKTYYHSLKDEDFYLQQTSYKYLPLSRLQRTKINTALGKKQIATVYLSPLQKKWLDNVKISKEKEILYHKDFVTSWETVVSRF